MYAPLRKLRQTLACALLSTLLALSGTAHALVVKDNLYGVKAMSAGEPNCPVAAEEVGTGACGTAGGPGASAPAPRSNEEHFYVSRSELVQMVEEALKARGLA